MSKFILTIISTILAILAIASGFTMLGSSDSVMQALGGWYLFIGVLLLCIGFLSGLIVEGWITGSNPSKRRFRV